MKDSAASPGHARPCALRRRWLGAAAVGVLGWCGPTAQAARAAPALQAVPATDLPASTDWGGLPKALRPVLAAAGLPPTCFGVRVAEVSGRGAPLASHNAEQAYQLASTAKVVTALAALDLLGAQYRWRTYAFTTGPIVGGRLLGDLLIVGGGDAGLRSASLLAWFEKLQADGLREVWGNVVLDRFAFRLSERDHANTPLPAADRPHHARPDALTLDEGVLQVSVQAAARGRASVQASPPLAGLKLINELGTEPGCEVWAQPASAPGGGPGLAVRGRWSAGCGTRDLAVAPLPHDEFTVRAVEGLWRQAGGKLKGRVLDKRLPDRDSLLPMGPDGEPVMPYSVHLSDPLPIVIREINKRSDNLGARNLMLSLVRGFPLRPATLGEARSRVEEWLLRQGLAPGDIALENGSGLSRVERGKPRAMVHLLQRAWSSPHAQAFIDSLPIAGVDGTLAHRMTGGKAAGSAFLKTGTLLDTRALAGYVRSASGRTHAVAVVVNHPEAQRATPALDAMIEWVARHG